MRQATWSGCIGGFLTTASHEPSIRSTASRKCGLPLALHIGRADRRATGLAQVVADGLFGKAVGRPAAGGVGRAEAVPGGEISARVQPLTVEMVARFDTIFTLMREAESMARLLRIASVSIVTDNRPEFEDLAVAKASIILEAVFDPSSQEVH